MYDKLNNILAPLKVDWENIKDKPDFDKVLDQLHHIRLNVDEGYKKEKLNKKIEEYYQSIIMTDEWYELAKTYVLVRCEYYRYMRRLFTEDIASGRYAWGLYTTPSYHPGSKTFKEYCYCNR